MVRSDSVIEVVGYPLMVDPDDWLMVPTDTPGSMLFEAEVIRNHRPVTADFYLMVCESRVEWYRKCIAEMQYD